MKVGALHYLNALPLVAGLETEPTVTEVRYEVPRLLAEDLRAGLLDLALVPQVEACSDPDYRIVGDLCVACDGDAESILVFVRKGVPPELGELRTIGVDVSSQTSVELLRVLLAMEGHRAELVPVPPRLDGLRIARVPHGDTDRAAALDAVLLIGDRALAEDRGEFARLDLGALWKYHTGLPFVFAFWLTRSGNARDVASLAITLGRIHDVNARRLPDLARAFVREYPDVIDVAGAERYIREVIRYRMGPPERESLEVFHARRRELDPSLPEAGPRP